MTILSATYHCIPTATRRMLPLAGVIVLIGSKPVDAAIVHSGVQNIPIATTFDGVYLDVNTSSNNYLATEFTGWDLNLFFGGLGISNSAGFQPIRSGTGNEDPILRLRLGSSVTSALSVSSGMGGSGADDDSGHVGPAANQFTSGQSGYFGFRLAAASGSIPYFYGWMRATLTSDGTAGVVHEWAYEEGGGSIVTGFSGSVGAAPKTITPGTPVTGSVAAAGTALLMGDPTAAFTFSGGGTYTGVIVGEGTINISGTDGLVLTGTNPFGGTAAVQDGSSLTVSSSGNLGSAEVKLGANSDLVFNPPATGTSGSTFDNTITIPAPTPITSGIVNGLGFGTGALSSTSGSIVTRDGIGALGTTLVEESGVTLSNTGAKVIDLTGSLAGSGNLLINGGGGFVLGGAVANTFSGLITVSHGNLMLNKSAGVNAIAGNVTVQGGLATGASLTVAASHQIANNAAVSVGAYGSFGFSGSGLTETIGSLTNSGGTFITGANTLIGSGNSITWSGGTNTVSAGGTLTDAHFLISGGTNTVDGGTTRGTLEVASGGSGLELGGVASPVLTLSSHATQAGRILLSGDVSVLSTLTTGTAQILSGGSAATAGYIDLGAGSRTFTVYDGDAATDLLISAGITNGALVKAGAGNLTITGAASYTGTTTISAGVLQIGDSGTAGALSPSGSITNNSALWFKRSNTITQGADFGTISGTGTLTQAGGGTLILSSANDYSGGTSVNTGILNIRHATALGSTSGATAVASGAALEIQGGISVGAEGLTLNGSGISTGGALRNISGSNEFGGLVTLASSTRIHSDAGTLNLSNAGTITGSGFALTVGGAGDVSIGSIIGTGSGSLTKEGGGSLTLSGANTYTGATTIGAGSLVLAAANRLSDATDVTISSGATFNLNGFAESVASLTGAGNLSLGAGNLTAGGDNTSTTFSGVISGSGGLTKTGSGTLTLSGLSDFSGGIRVESGTLSINGFSALSTAQAMGVGAVDLGVAALGEDPGSGGTLLYTGGAGTLAQAINILGANSVIRNGGSGVLDIIGSITRNSANAFLIDGGSQGIVISSAILGTTSGISTSGRVQLAGSVLDAAAIVDVSGTLIIGSSSGGTIQKVAGLSGSGGIAGNSTSGASFVNVDMASGSNDFSGTIGGGSTAEKNVGLTKSGGGTLILSGGSSNTYTALTVVNGGVLSLAKTSNAIAIGGNLRIDAGTLQIAASNQISNSSQITMTAGSFSFSGSGLTETVETFTNNGGTFVTGANTLIATGSTITWSGGTNTISAGGSTQDGHYLITGGTNTVEGGSSRGSLVVSSGGLGLELGGSFSPVVTLNSDAAQAGRILLSGNLSVLSTLTAGTAGILSGGSAANPGYIDLDGGVRTFTVNNGSAATDLQISAQVTHGGLTKAGEGTLALSAANTYAELTTISAGTLNIQHASGLGSGAAGTSVASGAALEIQGGIIVATESLTLNGGGISSGGALRNISGDNGFAGPIALAGDSRIHSDSGTLSLSALEMTGSGYGLTLGGAGNISISSMIGTGSGTLTKEGAGSLTLSGANTYTGATTITAGTVVLDGSLSSPVTVSSGGTLKGIGSISANLSVTGHLSPGDGIGTLAVTGTTTFTSGSIFDWNLDTSASNPETNSGVAYDTLTTDSVAGSGAILKILLTGTQDFSDSFWNSQRTFSNVFSVTESSNLAAVFSGGVIYSYNGQSAAPTSGSFQASGSSLTWSLVPEPGNALIGLLLGSVLLRRRREGRPSDETR